jgi:hypothetical protein
MELGGKIMPWTVFYKFWVKLAVLAEDTQTALAGYLWAVGPSRFYQWIVEVIDFCKDVGVPTLDQPSWAQFQEILLEKAGALRGTATDKYLTQVMEDWRDYDYTEAPPPNPYIPDQGPYVRVVAGYDSISTFLRVAAGRLFGYETNKDVDFAGRTVTLYEAVDVVWYVTRKMCDSPLFQMQDPQVPKWTTPYPWLEYCEKDLRKLKDMLKAKPDELPPPEDVPWSMPGV